MNGPDYKGKIAEFNRANAREVEHGVPPAKLAKVIEHMNEKGLPADLQDAYLEHIGSSSKAALATRWLNHTKSVTRQNVYEKAFYEYAQNVLPDLHISPLPAKGARALYPLNGEIVSARDCPANQILAKSFDFQVSGESGAILIATKHTGEEGGGQDNQFRDLISIGKSALGMSGDTAVLLIADGPYYDRPTSSTDRVSRIEFLRRMTADERQVAAGRGADLPALISRFRPLLDHGVMQ